MVKKLPVTIYHNPRCSKSRQTLNLLREHGIEPDIVEYLKEPPDAATLKAVLCKLNIQPIDLIRKKEPLFKELNLAAKADDNETLIKTMLEHPILIERPIVIKGDHARLGRPPEQVLEIL